MLLFLTYVTQHHARSGVTAACICWEGGNFGMGSFTFLFCLLIASPREEGITSSPRQRSAGIAPATSDRVGALWQKRPLRMAWPWRGSRETSSHSPQKAEDGKPCWTVAASLGASGLPTAANSMTAPQCVCLPLLQLMPPLTLPNTEHKLQIARGDHRWVAEERHECSEALAQDSMAWGTHSSSKSGSGHAEGPQWAPSRLGILSRMLLHHGLFWWISR